MHLAIFMALIFAVTCVLVSAVLELARRHAEPHVGRLSSRGQRRVYGVTLFAPVGLGLATALAVLAPSSVFGMPDHCLGHPDHHLHLCVAHGAPNPSVAAWVLGGGALLYALWAAGRALVALWASERASRRLARGACGRMGDALVLAVDAPMAFTAGVLRPRVFVSRMLTADPERWAAVFAHERAHARAADPRRRWLATLLGAFHLPGTGDALAAGLHEAQELAADEAAAQDLGDRFRVAEALVEWARSCRANASAPLRATFGEGPLRRRIDALTASNPRGSSLGWLPWIATLMPLALLAAAPALHHAVETLLGVATH